MINITYRQTKNNFLEISGHAGYDNEGRDIVCAAVSAVAFELAAFIDGDMKLGSGYMKMQFRHGKKEDAAFEMTVGGLKLIAEKYPDNINITQLP